MRLTYTQTGKLHSLHVSKPRQCNRHQPTHQHVKVHFCCLADTVIAGMPSRTRTNATNATRPPLGAGEWRAPDGTSVPAEEICIAIVATMSANSAVAGMPAAECTWPAAHCSGATMAAEPAQKRAMMQTALESVAASSAREIREAKEAAASASRLERLWQQLCSGAKHASCTGGHMRVLARVHVPRSMPQQNHSRTTVEGDCWRALPDLSPALHMVPPPACTPAQY